MYMKVYIHTYTYVICMRCKVRQGVDVENPESPKFLETEAAPTAEDRGRRLES